MKKKNFYIVGSVLLLLFLVACSSEYVQEFSMNSSNETEVIVIQTQADIPDESVSSTQTVELFENRIVPQELFISEDSGNEIIFFNRLNQSARLHLGDLEVILTQNEEFIVQISDQEEFEFGGITGRITRR
ncbi:MAG: hypothetical protein ACMXYA_02990 [Candidatus Woesearchaeota archaeon]